MTLEPDVKRYLEAFKTEISTRLGTLEREVTQLQRFPPAKDLAEFASDQAATAWTGVVEVRTLVACLEERLRGANRRDANRTRMIAAAMGAFAVVMAAIITISGNVSRALAREQAAFIVDDKISKFETRQIERDRRVLEAIDKVPSRIDVITGKGAK